MSDYLDLIHHVWTPQEFEQHELKVEEKSGDNVTLKIAFSPLQSSKGTDIIAKALPWTTGLYQGVKHWTLGKDATSIFSVSEALDEIAQGLLNQEFDHALIELKSPHSTKEKLKAILEDLQHLQNLKSNLENHNVVVGKFNDRFMFREKVVGCPTHDKILDQVNQKLNEFQKMEMELKHGLNSEFETLVEELETNLNNGLKMEKEVVFSSYPVLLEKIKELDPTVQENALRKLDGLINRHYLSNLIDKVSQDLIPLPLTLNVLKSKLGISDEVMKSKIASGHQELLEILRTYQQADKQRLHSPEFVHQIQKDFVKIVAKHLAPSLEAVAQFEPLIGKLYLLEVKGQQLMQQGQRNIRKEFDDILNTLSIDDEELQREKSILQDLWNRYEFPSLLPELFDQYFGQLKLDPSMFESPEKMATNLALLEDAYQKMKGQMTSQKIFDLYYNNTTSKFLDLAKEAKKRAHGPTWFEKNAHAKRFSFNQSSWGQQQIFGEGVCAAINYRWIRHLLERPSRLVKSADDLNLALKEQKEVKFWEKSPLFKKMVHTYEEEKEVSGVTAEDRITFATYGLELSLRAGEHKGSIGSTILKRDKLNFELLESSQPSIEALIDSLVNNHPESLTSPMTGGIFDISIYQYQLGEYKHGHSIGMQIDPSRQLFRFWDVNSGFYQYSTLDEMKDAFKDYMKEYYHGIYNVFMAGQYSKQVV